METLSLKAARRLALVRAGLLKPEWTGLPKRAAGRGKRARRGAQAGIERFGYLQLDTIPVVGARTHVLVLLSRLDGFDPALGEELLRPGQPLFEYWGHEACWLPMELYPTFEFRRRDYAHHPWWGDVLGEHPDVADRLLEQIRTEGPLRSLDMEGNSGPEMWEIKTAKKVAAAFWSRGDLAIRQRINFHKVYDLAERVIPAEFRERPQEQPDALRTLLLKALDGHGWAQTGTLTATWRLRNLQSEIRQALEELQDSGQIVPCALAEDGKKLAGWIRPADLELAERALSLRPRRDRGVLLSPFDPVLWDRRRVSRLFGFDITIEIYKPREQRVYGYYCLPVLAGERLVGRMDLKADRQSGQLRVLSCHYESERPSATDREAARSALDRYAESIKLRPTRPATP
jgi:uncharacterized protein YcaQ